VSRTPGSARAAEQEAQDEPAEDDRADQGVATVADGPEADDRERDARDWREQEEDDAEGANRHRIDRPLTEPRADRVERHEDLGRSRLLTILEEAMDIHHVAAPSGSDRVAGDAQRH